MKYGLIAQKLGHSFSSEIHARFGNPDYEMHELPPADLDAFMRRKDFSGINVTIPYKSAVIPYLDCLEARARATGAVNTVVNRNGKLYGYNTDFDGMADLFLRLGVLPEGKKVLILGSGGTSKTARAVCAALGAKESYFVRRDEKDGAVTYAQAYERHADASVIVNTTPCGMFPHGGELPTNESGKAIDLDAFPALSGVVDVVFNPLRTALVQSARARGIASFGGLYMLVSQAAHAETHFTGRAYTKDEIDAVYASILREKTNVVLIGMPGSGKTTVGKMIAGKLNREFVDTDEYLTKKTGRTPARIIREDGEAAFRCFESAAVNEIAQKSGIVIATGGGCVLKKENVSALKRNGVLFFLDRPIESIAATPDRPLSSDRAKLAAMFEKRNPIYLSSADATVKNVGAPETAAEEIVKRLGELRND